MLRAALTLGTMCYKNRPTAVKAAVMAGAGFLAAKIDHLLGLREIKFTRLIVNN